MNDVEVLLEKYNNGTATNQERELVESWYLRYKTESQNLSHEQIQEEYNSGLADLTSRINKKTIRLWPRLAVAASLLLVLSFGTYLLLKNQHSGTTQTATIINDIKPGTNSATLTLGNGKTILLNASANGQLAVQGGMAVTKTADGQLQYQQIGDDNAEVMINTITTRRKEQYKVILADGTSVWLNAASSIQYPTAFTGNTREVTITGEAYFEVAHNPAKPFRVNTNRQTVEVLGTHFNVNAYGDEPAVKTTLLEGSVRVSAGNSFKVIAPGEQSILKADELSVNETNTEESVAWKNGYFRFNQEKIEPLMRKLSRWYDIDVEFLGPVPDEEFSGAISRFTNISQVLNALEYYKTVHFKVEGRRVTVSKVNN